MQGAEKDAPKISQQKKSVVHLGDKKNMKNTING